MLALTSYLSAVQHQVVRLGARRPDVAAARHIVGPRLTPPRHATPSADAVLARAVVAAVLRSGSRADPFPLVQAKDPSWTRARWDRALAELNRDDQPMPASSQISGPVAESRVHPR